MNHAATIKADEAAENKIEQLRALEATVESDFQVGGKALKKIKDLKLFRLTHSNFEEYVHQTFAFSRRYAYYLLEAAATLESLEQCYQVSESQDSAPEVLPASEYQIRPLGRLERKLRPLAWREAVIRSRHKQPSHKLINQVVKEYLRTDDGNISQNLKAGQLCVVKNTYWGFIREVKQSRLLVENFEGTYDVVNTIDITESCSDGTKLVQFSKLQAVLKQIRKELIHETSARQAAEHFGKRSITCALSRIEVELLKLLMEHCKRQDQPVIPEPGRITRNMTKRAVSN